MCLADDQHSVQLTQKPTLARLAPPSLAGRGIPPLLLPGGTPRTCFAGSRDGLTVGCEVHPVLPISPPPRRAGIPLEQCDPPVPGARRPSPRSGTRPRNRPALGTLLAPGHVPSDAGGESAQNMNCLRGGWIWFQIVVFVAKVLSQLDESYARKEA